MHATIITRPEATCSKFLQNARIEPRNTQKGIEIANVYYVVLVPPSIPLLVGTKLDSKESFLYNLRAEPFAVSPAWWWPRTSWT